jgi:uncharacterized protein YndB with AHSA1/START domain
MMWALITVVGLIALIALIVLVGYLMPVRYEGRAVVEYDRSVQQVWHALQDVETHPMTGWAMKSVEALPADEGRPAWREDMGHGEVITVRTSTYEPPGRMVRDMSAGAVKMSSRWDYTLEPAGPGCRVSLSGVTDIERGTWHTPIFRLMMVVGGGVKKGLDTQLDMVASTLAVEASSS